MKFICTQSPTYLSYLLKPAMLEPINFCSLIALILEDITEPQNISSWNGPWGSLSSFLTAIPFLNQTNSLN